MIFLLRSCVFLEFREDCVSTAFAAPPVGVWLAVLEAKFERLVAVFAGHVLLLNAVGGFDCSGKLKWVSTISVE
jgi:hypothetical protein